jgi:hypothetical protein
LFARRQWTSKEGRMFSSISWTTLIVAALVGFSSFLSSSFSVYSSVLLSNRE